MTSILLALTLSFSVQDDDRMPIPDQAALAASRRSIQKTDVRERLVEKLEIEDRRDTPSGRTKLARGLLHLARETPAPSDRYALYREALDVAVESCSASATNEVVLELAREFQVDRWKLLLEALDGVRPEYAWQAADTVERMLEWAEAALAEDDCEVAVDLVDAAKRVVKKADHRPLADLAKKQGERIKSLVRGFRSAQKTLLEDPSNDKASELVGTFECVYRGNWDAGLVLLENAASGPLSTAARSERMQPDGPEEWQALGEAWVAAARAEEDGRAAGGFLRHAADCLEKARAGLAGLQEMQVANRVGELVQEARELELEPTGKALDDQLEYWKVGAKVEGTRALGGAKPRLIGQVVRSDGQGLEIELRESWTTLKGIPADEKWLWRFERSVHDPRTGRVTYAVRDGRRLGPGDPNHRRNYSGEVAVRGRLMAGEYAFEFRRDKEFVLGGPLEWVLEVK